jgi:hypothetical protein
VYQITDILYLFHAGTWNREAAAGIVASTKRPSLDNRRLSIPLNIVVFVPLCFGFLIMFLLDI